MSQQQRLGSYYNRYSDQNFIEANRQSFAQNDYKTVYDKPTNTSLLHEPNMEYEHLEHYLSISSRDRDMSLYPDVNKYIVNFPREFKNIHSIELVQAIIPAQNNVEQEPYLLLNIDEIQDVMISNDRYIANAFAFLQLAAPTTASGFIQIDKRIHENTVKTFQTPKASLSKMTINISDCTGTLFNFGTDGPTPLKSLQNTFIFKIITLEKRRRPLDQRNVY
jgi:hypothetical protein